jgi:glycosyltransferase involved in cell wall biosynthesis
MDYPRISIVTPSYNQAKYLPQTIESILRQDYPNLEYIIIDGGSTDGSVDVIRRYESHLACWVSEKDRGQSEAINKGFRRASGVLFNWINSDDLLFPGALQRIAAAYRRHPDAALIVGDHARADDERGIFRVSAAASRRAFRPAGWVMPVGQQSAFVASAVFARLGGVREDLHCIMDTELYYRILTVGGRPVRARGLIGLIREHPQCKGRARAHEWRGEIDRVCAQCRISNRRHRVALLHMRLWRTLDGSYLRSCLLGRRWVGKWPWNGTTRGTQCRVLS